MQIGNQTSSDIDIPLESLSSCVHVDLPFGSLPSLLYDQEKPPVAIAGGIQVKTSLSRAPPVEFCEVDPMQTESLASKIACICLYLPVFARACARYETYKSFQSYACHLRNPAVQQATVEIRDTEFPAPPRFLAARRT